MKSLGPEITFWLAVIGATVVKVLTSPYHSLRRTSIMVFVAVFSAWIFTDPVVYRLGLDAVNYRNAIAALICLTAEGVVRAVIYGSNHPQELMDFWKKWRGQ